VPDLIKHLFDVQQGSHGLDSFIEVIYDVVDDGEKLGRGTVVMTKTVLDVTN
jgi:hypothetical protein